MENITDNSNEQDNTEVLEEKKEAQTTEQTQESDAELQATEQAQEINTELQTAEQAQAQESDTESQAAEQAQQDENGEQDAETTEESAEQKTDLAKKVKIGIVIAGGIFILLAAVYAASVMGGRNLEIKEEEPVVVVEEPEITPEPTAAPTIEITPEVVEEEDRADDSLIGLVQGNARYDDCIYADGGVVIVKSGDKYGAIDYEGKEIVKTDYAELIQKPTAEGRFVLSNSKVESKTEEHDGTTYTYDAKITTYTMFDNTGKKVYEGNNEVLASKDVLVMAVEDSEDIRKNRVEYYKFADLKKAFLTLYVTDQFSMNGFNADGKTVVMGYSAPPTEDQDTNPTNLNCGVMDENGKIKWFSKVPGTDEFKEEVKKWKEENKVTKTTKSSKKKVDKDNAEDAEENEEDENVEKKYDEDGNEIIEDEEDITEDELDEENVTEEDEAEDTENEGEVAEDENDVDTSAGPIFHMNEILSAPSEGFFVYKDLYDVEDSYSVYTDGGVWYADLDTSYMQPDSKKGFVLGNFNNGAVDVKRYIYNGENYWNIGSNMVITVGNKDVLVDVSKAKGMTGESLTDKIVVAVYDSISLSDSDYWAYKDGKTCGYMDRKGKALKLTYNDVTDFVNGYAVVVKDGKAIIINDKFEELEEIGPAVSVDIAGDMMLVYRDGGVRRYMFKTTRENPTGEEKSDDKANDKEDPKATLEASTSKKNSKKK